MAKRKVKPKGAGILRTITDEAGITTPATAKRRQLAKTKKKRTSVPRT
jgi:hypothetical protein